MAGQQEKNKLTNKQTGVETLVVVAEGMLGPIVRK